jgi:hypothetical protein
MKILVISFATGLLLSTNLAYTAFAEEPKDKGTEVKTSLFLPKPRIPDPSRPHIVCFRYPCPNDGVPAPRPYDQLGRR